ncbi:hypothetical protein [Echinicola sp. 20G]|uniref:hypothetical protein n=1 Tax=Echinicola sp. 20G TaxID=2781961 RepID=UPI001F4891B0|nr:hypothetical protein [Echinicola sp. 20G]
MKHFPLALLVILLHLLPALVVPEHQAEEAALGWGDGFVVLAIWRSYVISFTFSLG